jgi:formate hydrogenlyase subunit 4
VIEALEYILAYLVFPGILFAGAVGLLFAGIDRKLTGHMQNRIGPPIWQEFLDVGKLFGKEDITPTAANSFVFNCAPLLCFGAIMAVMLLLPINSSQPVLTSVGDLIVIIYLLNIPAVCMMLAGYASGCPFGTTGSSRYMVQLFGYELAFIIAALAAAAKVGWSLSLSSIVSYQAQNGWMVSQVALIPAAIAILIAAQGKLLRAPFDIPEAESEIVHGSLTEYSGPKLGILRIAYDIEVFVVAAVITVLFFGGPVPHTIGGIYIPGVVSFLIKCLGIVVLSTIIRNIAARLRIDQALKFFWTFPTLLAAISLFLVVVT